VTTHTITLNGERFDLPLPVEIAKIGRDRSTPEIVFHLGLDDSLHHFPTARDYTVEGSPFDELGITRIRIQRSGYQKLGSLVVYTVSASVLSLFNIFVDCDHA
jgi:hypothetical protein